MNYNRASKFGDKVQSVTKQNAGAMEDILETAKYIANASNEFFLARDLLNNRAPKVLTDIVQARENIEYRILDIDRTLPELRNATSLAEHHTNILRNRVSVNFYVLFPQLYLSLLPIFDTNSLLFLKLW